MHDLTSGFPAAFRRSGQTLEEAAELLRLSPRQVKRYLAGDTPAPARITREMMGAASSRIPDRNAPAFRFIDLFAGIGGLRLGFEAIGGKCVFTSEWDRWSQKTYARNFPDGDDHMMVGDITPYGANPALIPEFDVLLAGSRASPSRLPACRKRTRSDASTGSTTRNRAICFSRSSGSSVITGRPRFC